MIFFLYHEYQKYLQISVNTIYFGEYTDHWNVIVATYKRNQANCKQKNIKSGKHALKMNLKINHFLEKIACQSGKKRSTR